MLDLPGMTRLALLGDKGNETNGCMEIRAAGGRATLRVIFSDGFGWDHVSVTASRTPTWDEMCYVKGMFFYEDECVVQYHPPVAVYVNCHPRCLHLWRPQAFDIQLPPTILIGPTPTPL